MTLLTVPAFVLERRPDEVYVHYANTDKRLDEWVSESSVRLTDVNDTVPGLHIVTNGSKMKKRKRSFSPPGLEEEGEEVTKEVKMSEEEYDI